MLIIRKPLFHRFNQQKIVIVPAEAPEEAKRHPYFCRKCWRSSPRWWEVSYPLHTNSIHRLCIQPYHWQLCEEELAFLILSNLNLKIRIYFSAILKKEALYWKLCKSFAYPCVNFLTTTTLDNIWLCRKFHPDLMVEQEILKINFSSREIRKSIFLQR